MNGAEALVATSVKNGIEMCFANPGTTEMSLVLALDAVPGVRGVLCLHENVATGAADGYGRMAGKPAMCILHLGPGLANGLTNLHNARRAATPMMNIIGEHATWHSPADPLLASDIEAVARFASGFISRNDGAATLAADLAAALEATRSRGGQIATMIVPHDYQIADVACEIPICQAPPKAMFSGQRVVNAVRALKRGRSAILLGGAGLTEDGLHLAGRIAAACGAQLICETFFARMERGGSLPAPVRLPYFPDQAIELTRRFESVVIAGTRRPVAFFGYPGMPSYLTTEEQTVMLTGADEDTIGALAAVATELDAPREPELEAGALPPRPAGPLTSEVLCAVIAGLQPPDAIIMDETPTIGAPYFAASRHAACFTHLMLTGGAIGEGPGAATGAALACPGRKVINFQSDGCCAYSVQAFWTQAREKLDVVTVIGSNRSYNILKVELLRAGADRWGPITRSMTALDEPFLDWVKIGEGFGVPSVAVETAEGLSRELERALAEKGPWLIEAIMS
jgi:acetolactate synthase-1/2/3 large subunit